MVKIMCSIAMLLLIIQATHIPHRFGILDFQLFFDMSFDSNEMHENVSFIWRYWLSGEWNLFLEKE